MFLGKDLPSCCPVRAWGWRLNKMGLSCSQTPAWTQWALESVLGSPFVCSVQRFQGCAPAQRMHNQPRGLRVPTALHWPLGSSLCAAHRHLRAPGTSAESSFSSAFATLASPHSNRLSAQFWVSFPLGLLGSEPPSGACHLGTI